MASRARLEYAWPALALLLASCASGSGSVAADDDFVWFTAHDVRAIWRLPIR